MRTRYFSPITYRLHGKLLEQITDPVQRKEAERLLASGEIRNSQELAERYGLQYESKMGVEKQGYKHGVSQERKLDVLRKIGREKGRVPTTSDLAEHGMTPSNYASFGGLGVAVRKVVKEESEDAIDRGKTIEDLEREKPWWWESVPRKMREEKTFEERFIPEEERKEKREQAEKVRQVAESERKVREKLKETADEIKKQMRGIDAEIEEANEAYFNKDIRIRRGIKDPQTEIANQIKELKSKKATLKELLDSTERAMQKKNLFESGDAA